MAKVEERAIDYGVLTELLGFQLRRAQLKLFQDFSESLAGAGITPGQTGLLVLIGENPGLTQSALAKAVNVERATLGEAVDNLVARGWVERQPHPRDGRAYALELTAAGRAFLDELIPAIRAHEAKVSARLSRAEFERLRALLAKFIG